MIDAGDHPPARHPSRRGDCGTRDRLKQWKLYHNDCARRLTIAHVNASTMVFQNFLCNRQAQAETSGLSRKVGSKHLVPVFTSYAGTRIGKAQLHRIGSAMPRNTTSADIDAASPWHGLGGVSEDVQKACTDMLGTRVDTGQPFGHIGRDCDVLIMGLLFHHTDGAINQITYGTGNELRRRLPAGGQEFIHQAIEPAYLLLDVSQVALELPRRALICAALLGADLVDAQVDKVERVPDFMRDGSGKSAQERRSFRFVQALLQRPV